MASCATILSLQCTPVAGRAPSHVVQPVNRRQPREARAGALGDMDVAVNVATSAQLQGAEAVDPSVYIGLGLLLASFVGTFGVAPMFKSSFKEQDRCELLLVPEALQHLRNAFSRFRSEPVVPAVVCK